MKFTTGVVSSFKGRYIFPLIAFLIPIVLRAIPEILMSPYVVGFDTMSYYIPTTSLWLQGGLDIWSYFSSAPLFYTIVVFFVSLGGPLAVVLKIMPVILHGLLGLSIYAYARKGLSWSPRKSTLTALVGTVYFVALRISWDLLRNELALIFFFLLLALLGTKQSMAYSWKHYVLLSLSAMAVVLAHQLVAVVMLGVLIFTIVQKLLQKERAYTTRLFLALLPSALFFVIVYISPAGGIASLDFSRNVGWPLSDFSSYQSMLASDVGFFLYCYLPLLPMALLSAKRFRNLQLRSWLFISLILVLVPIAILSNFRWLLMLVYPIAFYAVDGLSLLKSISWKRFGITLHRIGILYLVVSVSVLSLGFTLLTTERPFAYFDAGQYNGYIYQIPSSMLQNTISLADCNGTASALQWFKNNTDDDAFLLTHEAFYGWSLTTLNMNQSQIIPYGFGDPAQAAENATQQGHDKIYLIWWINGVGWYGQPTVAASFEEVYHSGRIAIYRYAPT
jgi:hypothetical protein